VHLTDIHYALDRVEQLKSWLAARDQTVDTVLVSGDIADQPMDENNRTPEVIQRYRGDLETVLDRLSQIKSEIYFIPGNHDALPLFDVSEDSPTLVPSPPPFPCNMHLKRAVIAPKLHLLGLGGSVPGYREGKKVWDSFPYKTHAEMDADAHKLLDPVFFEDTSCLSDDDCVVLMTHNGPADSDTAYVRNNPHKPTVSGNKELMKLLSTENMQRHTVLSIHGHSHDSPGQCVVGRTRILNPGPLVDGCFGVYTLRRRATGTHPSWEVASVCFHSLPSL
jgi:Icc-related predicted phosphoesterase